MTIRRIAVLAVAITALVLTAKAVSAQHGSPAREPLWAYGFDSAPAYDEPAAPPQPLPTHALRPNEPVEKQLRQRHMEGSSRSFSLLENRDGHNVVDWFPEDHPTPMPDIIAHGPNALGEAANGCG